MVENSPCFTLLSLPLEVLKIIVSKVTDATGKAIGAYDTGGVAMTCHLLLAAAVENRLDIHKQAALATIEKSTLAHSKHAEKKESNAAAMAVVRTHGILVSDDALPAAEVYTYEGFVINRGMRPQFEPSQHRRAAAIIMVSRPVPELALVTCLTRLSVSVQGFVGRPPSIFEWCTLVGECRSLRQFKLFQSDVTEDESKRFWEVLAMPHVRELMISVDLEAVPYDYEVPSDFRVADNLVDVGLYVQEPLSQSWADLFVRSPNIQKLGLSFFDEMDAAIPSLQELYVDRSVDSVDWLTVLPLSNVRTIRLGGVSCNHGENLTEVMEDLFEAMRLAPRFSRVIMHAADPFLGVVVRKFTGVSSRKFVVCEGVEHVFG